MSLIPKIYNENSEDDLDKYKVIISDLDNNPYPTQDNILVLGETDDIKHSQSHLLLFIFDKDSIADATDQQGHADLNFMFENLDMMINNQKSLAQAKILGHNLDVVFCTNEFIKKLTTRLNPASVGEEIASDLANEFNSIIENAIDCNANNLHLEVRPFGTLLRIRVGGELVTIKKWPYSYGKHLAHTIFHQTANEQNNGFLNGSFQSGTLLKTIEDRHFKIDVNAAPVKSGGVDIIVHIHDLDVDEIKLSEIGYSDDHLRMIVSGSSLASGLVVIAGRSSSGKIESLRGVLHEKIAKSQKRLKLVVIGERASCLISDSTQININGTLSVLIDQVVGLDPDLIMIDEINSKDSANLAMHLAQIGFPVYTTINARSVIGIFDRLSSLGIPHHVLGAPGFINCLVYQANLPALCHHCRVAIDSFIDNSSETNDQFIQRIRCVKDDDSSVFVRGNGCEHCRNGVVGQILVAETMLPDFKILQCISEKRSVDALTHWLRNSDQIIVHGIAKMNLGIVSPEDIESSFGPLIMPVILNDDIIERDEIRQLSAKFVDKPEGNVVIDSDGWNINPMDSKWDSMEFAIQSVLGDQNHQTHISGKTSLVSQPDLSIDNNDDLESNEDQEESTVENESDSANVSEESNLSLTVDVSDPFGESIRM